jgi:hyperosmotically inducible protein
MSTDAHNVKIITKDRHVTLRGPVKSEDEKKRIEEIAQDVAGSGNVDNQLEFADGG